MSLGAWLQSKIGEDDQWLDDLINIANSNNDLQNIYIVEDTVNSGKCLSLTKTAQPNYKFSLISLDCHEKRIPLCRIDPPKIAAPSKPPKFPCIGKTARNKRGINDKSILNGL